MKIFITYTIEVKTGQYWRDCHNVRNIIQGVLPNEIMAIDEITSTPRSYTANEFYRKFRFEN